MKNILEVKNIGKKYQNKEDEIQALKNVNFRIKEGEFVSIIGPSGCGKSTLLSIIAGLEEKTEGEIYIEGEKCNGISPKIGYMLQRDCLLEWRNILSNTLFGLEIKGIFCQGMQLSDIQFTWISGNLQCDQQIHDQEVMDAMLDYPLSQYKMANAEAFCA